MKVVIDAGVGVHSVLASSLNPNADAAWESWRGQGASIYAPTLWLNEVASVLHRTFMQGLISEGQATEALDKALELDLEWVMETADLCRAAFRWASRLKQHAAYDGFYLALAESLGAEFWTADQRLATAVRAEGVSWAHSLQGGPGEDH